MLKNHKGLVTMNITVHRGTHQIGGSAIEISTESTLSLIHILLYHILMDIYISIELV